MEDREFFVIVTKINGAEDTEEYEDFDDARADFVNTVNYGKNYNYIILQHVIISNGIEEIEEIESDYKD